MIRQPRWLGPTICLLAIFSASLLLARQGVVKTRDGRTLTGDVEEKPDGVVMKIHGIQTRIDRDNIAAIEYFDNIEARYKDMLAKLPKPATAKDHLGVARWLFDARAYDLALRECDEARRLDPNSAEAITLEQNIINQRRIEQNKATGTPGVGTVTRPVTPGTGTRPGTEKVDPGEKKLLTADDINVIRQFEWRKNDTVAPRVTVPVDVRKKYTDLKGIRPADFSALSLLEQALTILDDRDAPAELKRAIKVNSDPQLLAEYRRQIQPLVVAHCATSGCHGGHAAGRFFLFNTNTDRDDVTYTNYYILRKYKQSVNDRECLMIDPQFENLTILSQFALPPQYAELKHPEIKGQTYKPLAGSKNVQQYRALVAWMKELTMGDPNYGITYTLPTSTPARSAAPATRPAATVPAVTPRPANPATRVAPATRPAR